MLWFVVIVVVLLGSLEAFGGGSRIASYFSDWFSFLVFWLVLVYLDYFLVERDGQESSCDGRPRRPLIKYCMYFLQQYWRCCRGGSRAGCDSCCYIRIEPHKSIFEVSVDSTI